MITMPAIVLDTSVPIALYLGESTAAWPRYQDGNQHFRDYPHVHFSPEIGCCTGVELSPQPK